MGVRFPNRLNQRRLILKIAKEYGIKVHFYTKEGYAIGIGFHKVNFKKRTDSIHLLYSPRVKNLLSVFFHELGHSFCYRNGIYPLYHNFKVRHRKGEPYWSQRELRGKINTGFKAECFVDRWARDEMDKHFPDLIYCAGYLNQPDAKEWLYENHLIQYVQRLK